MSEWLDLMLGEVARKNEEEKMALEEAARREKSSPNEKPAAKQKNT